ncbi:MAG TPA: hypothetical protein VFA77_00800 [Candidatus Eisenbacteria bacterium]|jgi:hypothetical protein|nr:hypothetical protein [Candidatus Eisenbacteria bacterium]
MEIWHRGHIDKEHKSFLEANSIKHEPWFSVRVPGEIRNYMFEIHEGHAAWGETKARLAGRHTYIRTKSSVEEQLSAEWSIIYGESTLSNAILPSFKWSDKVIQGGCKNCGTGWRQVASYTLKKELPSFKRHFGSFGLGFELFARPEIVQMVRDFGASGFDSWPLLLKKEKQEATSLSQLITTPIAPPAIVEDLVEHERYGQTDCPLCGQTWHAYYTRGMLPMRRAALIANVDFQLTHEWFGNTRIARHETLVSNRIVRLIFQQQWTGVELVPIHVVN